MRFKVRAAKARLSQLIEATLRGEDAVIARGAAPIVRLVPMRRNRYRFGMMAAELADPLPDFLEPMSENDPRLWEGIDQKRFE